MTDLIVISGFTGAGKTTFIRRLLQNWGAEKRICIIENEFGEVGLDGELLRGVPLRELAGGCICCTMTTGFLKAAEDLLDTYAPDFLIVEPTGIGYLSDILRSVRQLIARRAVRLRSLISVVDAVHYELFSQMYGDFFSNQIQEASTLVLSRTQFLTSNEVTAVCDRLGECNEEARIFSEPWQTLDLADVMEPMEHTATRRELLRRMKKKTDETFCTLVVPLSENAEKLKNRLDSLNILRSKGYVLSERGSVCRFEYTAGEMELTPAQAQDDTFAVLIAAGISSDALQKRWESL